MSIDKKPVRCVVTGQEVPTEAAVPLDLVRDSLIPTLKGMSDHWDPKGFVSLDALNQARMRHVEDLLLEDQGSTRQLREAVVSSLRDSDLLSAHTDAEFDRNQTFGQRLADKIASFGGSWTFISCFAAVLAIWIMANDWFLHKPFDPFPFILLNLVLSCLAAIQAPVIMMSQNRKEARDRMRAINDYQVNLKAELEIRHLNEKLDKLMLDQWQHLLEIQQMQVEMLKEKTKEG